MKVVWLHGELDLMAETEADIQVLRSMHEELVGPAVYDITVDGFQPTKPGGVGPGDVGAVRDDDAVELGAVFGAEEVTVHVRRKRRARRQAKEAFMAEYWRQSQLPHAPLIGHWWRPSGAIYLWGGQS